MIAYREIPHMNHENKYQWMQMTLDLVIVFGLGKSLTTLRSQTSLCCYENVCVPGFCQLVQSHFFPIHFKGDLCVCVQVKTDVTGKFFQTSFRSWMISNHQCTVKSHSLFLMSSFHGFFFNNICKQFCLSLPL